MTKHFIAADKVTFAAFQCDKLTFFALIFTLFFLPIYNSYTSIGIGLAIFFFLVKTSLSLPKINKTGLHTFLYCFLLICLFSLLFSTDRGETLKGLKKLSMHVFLYFSLINSVNSKERLKWIICFFILSALIVSLDGFYQLAYGTDWFSGRPVYKYPYWQIRRISASFHQAGSLGMYLGAAVPIAWSFIFINTRPFIKRITASFSALIITLALILSFTPGAALGLIFALLFFIMLKKGGKYLWYSSVFITTGIFLLPYSLIGSFLTTIIGRVSMWAIAVKIFFMHPVFGAGLRTFPLNYQKYCPAGYPFYRECPPYAHNMYLQLLSEIGLIGLICFLIFLYVLISKLTTVCIGKKDPMLSTVSLGLAGSFVVYITHGVFESSIYTSQGGTLFWLLTGLMASCILVSLRKQNEAPRASAAKRRDLAPGGKNPKMYKYPIEDKDVRNTLFL